MKRLTAIGSLLCPLLPVLASATPAGATCAAVTQCITVDADGMIDRPWVTIRSGESVGFQLGNRWQSVIDIQRRDSAACDDESLEKPYSRLAGLTGLTGPMPRFAGGIVLRGSADRTFRFGPEVWASDAISGVFVVVPWQALELSYGVYDFSPFTDALREASKYGKLVSIGVQAGSKAPSWIYQDARSEVPGTAMVTKATSGSRCFDQTHPSFWDASYVELMTNLQTALATELKQHAGIYRHIDKIKITGVNLMTSETRLPVERSQFCGFRDRRCSNGDRDPLPCVQQATVTGKTVYVCPQRRGCGCFADADDVYKCGRTTDDLPQKWADAGYRPSKLSTYFDALFAEQHALFPEKDINLQEIARAFPNVDETGAVLGFANPDHVRQLIEKGRQVLPDHFVVLNAALNANAPPQSICLESYDNGVQQIGLQTAAGLDTWGDLQPALANAEGATTPVAGVQAVSFVEIYEETFRSIVQTENEPDLRAFDETFRTRSGLPNSGGQFHRVGSLVPGTYHYKIAGTHMTSGQCHTGTVTVLRAGAPVP